MSTSFDGIRDHRWLAATAAHVARTVAEHAPDAGEQLGIVREPTAEFVALVLGCLRAGVRFTILDPDNPVPPRLLGVSTVLDAAALPTEVAEPGDEPVPPGGWAEKLGPGDRVAVLSGMPAQVVSGVSSAVAAGAELHLDSPPLTDPDAVTGWLRGRRITAVFATAPVLRAVTSGEQRLESVRQFIVENTGDLLVHDVEALRRAAPSCRLCCAYRTSGDGHPLASYEVPDGWLADEAPLRLPLGTLPSDRDAQLLTASDRPAAVGEVGELRVAGSRTGDLLRRWPDGVLEFVGTAGTGREVLEAVTALRELPGIRDAVVTERFDADGEPVLAAYVTGPDAGADPAAVRRTLAVATPETGMPAHLVVVDELPLTSTGEYDLDALPDPVPTGDDYVAARTPLEEELTAILRELLRTDRIGVLDSFFELGGFSLLATQLASRIRERFGVELSLREIFEAPTVDGLAQLIVRRELELSDAGELEALLEEIERSDTGS